MIRLLKGGIIMKAIFTDYDTVKMDGRDEMTTKDFFDLLEKEIKNGKISGCNYDAVNEVFSFNYYDHKFEIKDFNQDIHNLKVLLVLMEFENTKIKRERRKEEEEKSLLEEARKGNIKNIDAKNLYLSELKNEVKLFNLIKNNIKLDDYSQFWEEEITYGLMIVYFFGGIISLLLGLIGPLVGIIDIKLIIPLIVASIASFFGSAVCHFKMNWGGSLVGILLARIVDFIINIFGNLVKFNKDFVKKVIPKRRILKHKIKWLESHQVHSDEIVKTNKENSAWPNYVAKAIDNVYVKLLKLESEDKIEIIKELEGKLKEYQSELSNIPKSGLTLETETTVSTRFITYLAELELRIEQKLNARIKNNALNANLEYMDKELVTEKDNNEAKKRVLEI